MRRFRYWADPLCLLAGAAYATNRWLLLPRLSGRFLHGQFNDLFLIPAALPPVLWLQRRLGLRAHDQPPDWREIVFHLLVWSILFEAIGPHLLRVTGDPWDVAAYSLGASVAGVWWNARRRSAERRG